ncbi:DUF305 domain-containing protein [Teichococcus vastitatis]|uniref:DUF305 domain-containing protein n=1 Tax=Teichococcus vastitatis TaxID=2307076 RepID=A0ABS9W9F7_9PROT|nr:DUF305 domain-containing protein [Pseudoroseomonas vastitatis]MCI0755876.1 DUF305 domain-containing protein [Pseudoroseomonas vastitatis]
MAHRLNYLPFRRTGVLVALLASLGPALAHEGHHHHPPPPRDAAVQAPPFAEQPFLAENDAAMARMMDAMAIQPSGNIDRDFVAMMAAHHQGAIDMATTLLRHGGNEQLRRPA